MSSELRNSSHKINLLPEHIIDQIKAGEVIERPATLLKELLENSVDAGSTKISIHIINFGLDLISVEDNGEGIDYEDLPLAFCRHATSKIEDFDDLYKLYTYGFRGEALASMSSVSKVTCTSNRKNTPIGTIKISGGEVLSQNRQDSSQLKAGTGIYVKDLFFNTPVRMKFLQSQTSEKNQLKKIINAFLLTHPEIEFSIKWDDSTKAVFPIVENLQDRVKKLFEKKKDPLELIHFNSEYDQSKLEMYLSLNSSKGHAGKFQYIFINGRFVQDVQLHKIILNSAQSLWPFGETGNYIAFLSISPDQLDVNVHPNKTVIKLFAASSIFSLVSSSIKQYLPKASREIQNSPVQSSLTLDKDIKDFGEINYKSQNFTEPNSLNHYFANLDNSSFQRGSNIDKSEINILFKDQFSALFQQDQKFYICNNRSIFKFYLESLLFEDKEKVSTPLLVSSPMKIERKITNDRFKAIASIGFEIDFFDEETLVLRAFPQILSSLPFEDILKVLLNSKTILKDQRWTLYLDDDFQYIPTRGNLESILEIVGISSLIQQGCLKKITGKDLLKIL